MVPDLHRSLLSKVGAIFDTLGCSPSSMNLSQISHRSGLAMSTACRLLLELVDFGYVERDGNEYRLGDRLTWLGQQIPLHEDLRGVALPRMADLLGTLGDGVYLGVLGPGKVTYLDRLVDVRRIHSVGMLGDEVPLHASASGRILLAHCERTVFTDLVSRGLSRYTSETVTDVAELRRRVDTARERGWATSSQERVAGFSGIAAPIRAGGAVVGAIAVARPAQANGDDQAGAMLRAITDQIGLDLDARRCA